MGEYEITATYTNGNYDITFVNGTLTVEKADVDEGGITFDNVNAVYGYDDAVKTPLPEGVTGVRYEYRDASGNLVSADGVKDVGVYTVHELAAFLEEYGPVLPKNQNILDHFLADNIRDVSDLIMRSDLTTAYKLKEMQRMLDHPTTQDILQRRVVVPTATIKSSFLAVITPNMFSPEKTQEMMGYICSFIRTFSPNCSSAVTPQNVRLLLEDRSWLRARIGDDALQKFYIEHHRTFLLLFGSQSLLRFFPGNSTPLLQSIIQDNSEELLRRLKQLTRKRRLAAQYNLPAAILALQSKD